MDLDEYKKQLNIEPRGEDPVFLEARRESLAHAAAHRQAMEFEDLLKNALKTPVSDDSADQIIANCLGPAAASRGRLPVWLGLAATLILAAGAAAWLLPGAKAPPTLDVRAAFVEHLDYPEPALTSSASITPDRVQAAFATAGLEVDGSLGDVTYLSPCIIGGKKGLHLVITDDEGRKATLMMIPGEQLLAAVEFTLPGISARLLPTDRGPIALFGHQLQDLEPLSRNVLRSISPFPRTALL